MPCPFCRSATRAPPGPPNPPPHPNDPFLTPHMLSEEFSVDHNSLELFGYSSEIYQCLTCGAARTMYECSACDGPFDPLGMDPNLETVSLILADMARHARPAFLHAMRDSKDHGAMNMDGSCGTRCPNCHSIVYKENPANPRCDTVICRSTVIEMALSTSVDPWVR